MAWEAGVGEAGEVEGDVERAVGSVAGSSDRCEGLEVVAGDEIEEDAGVVGVDGGGLGRPELDGAAEDLEGVGASGEVEEGVLVEREGIEGGIGGEVGGERGKARAWGGTFALGEGEGDGSCDVGGCVGG